MGRLEESRLRLAGVGERAALVPEQLGLEERFRNRRAVDRHERTIGPRPDTVDQPGDEALARARARLAVEEDRGQMARTELAIEQRSEERRVGKECRRRGGTEREETKEVRGEGE